MDADSARITEMDPAEIEAVRGLLVDLTLEEQRHFDHPRETAGEVAARLRITPRYSAENRFLVAHDDAGAAIGFCWVSLFDPGNGLEAEVVELYVRPEHRGRGVATRLATTAMALIRESGVTFASVWTRSDNPAALAVYRAAGFTPTEQTVLTWLPL